MKKTPAYYRARMDVLESILSIAHSSINVDGNPVTQKKIDTEIVLARNGVFPSGYDEEKLVTALLGKREYSNEPLSFSEITRYNTWFNLHPEKVAGKEIITSSRAFTLSIEGTKEDIIKTIRGEGGKMSLKEKALKLKEKLKSGLAGLADDVLFGMCGLGELVREEVNANIQILKKAVEHSRNEKEYKETDSLSFDEVISLYNKGLTEEEIKAWVWYKRSLGVPMKGWDKYFLPNTGEAGQMIYTVRPTVIKDNHFRDIANVLEKTLLGKPTRFKNEYGGTVYLVFTALNGDKQYVAEKDIRIEKTGIKTDKKFLDKLVEKDVLCYHEGDLEPYPIYAYGNMYDRELQLEKDKEYIISYYGEEIYNRQKEIVQKAKPELLSIFNPDEKMRPKILAISGFADEFRVRELKEETGIELAQKEDDYTLQEAFKYYLASLSRDQFKVSSPFEIWNYYVEARRITDKDLTEEQRRELKANARNEGEEMFSKFLFEALTFEDQEKLNLKWNRTYNGQSSIAYHRIPIGFECSAKFKQFNLEFTPAQRQGVAFMEAVGSGIIAYDVGVGKTMTAIIALAQAIYSGKASRPLIVVPNPTYGKWIKEIIGFVDDKTNQFVPGVLSNTKIKVNEWYNLGTDILKSVKLNKKIEASTITVVTYEGFKKIGFSDKIMDQMFVELTNILYQSTEKSDRDKEIDYQKYREAIGVGQKGTEADIDALGIDYIVIDEAHRCKNVFEGVKADEDGKKRFGISGAVSETGIKAFFLCNYIQRTYGRNVMLLTATPFTNSPLEIYSILSLVAYESMKKLGIYNIHTFFELFVLERTEFVVNYKEEIVPKDTVKSFNNRLLLQKLIYNHINYMTGEEAGVKRPCKINLPRINAMENGKFRRLLPEQQILTYLKMTDRQRQNQNSITALAKSATQGRLNMSAIFRALNFSLDNALSPFLYEDTPEDYLEFVNESPKIKYVMECIASVKAWHDARNEAVSGQVIYMNRGKHYFPLVKEYLEKEVGYKAKVKWNRVTVDEVEIITSEMSQTRKENIKEAFLDGVVKIIIGTSTIREGIDLQKKGTVIYNAYPDWNPTDIRQLEGRIWRQGNEFGYVRSVMPLVQDSMDVFVFQKLEEKTSRINDIWYRGDRGNVLDLESLDPEEVKFALLSDIEVIAGMKLKQIKAEIERRLFALNANLETLSRFDVILRRFFDLREQCIDHLRKAKTIISETELEDYGWEKKDLEKAKEANEEVVKAIDAFLESAPQSDKELLRTGRLLEKESVPREAQNIWLFSEFKQYLSNVKKAEKTILAQKGYTINDNMQDILSAFKADKEKIIAEQENAASEEFFAELKDEARMKKSAMAVSGATPEERAKDFAKLNYLLTYRATDVDSNSCQLPVGENTNVVNLKDRRRSRLKLKAKALKLKLQLQNAA
jgi:hypothetical protein